MFHILIAVGLLAGLGLGLLAAATGSGALMAFATGVEPLGAAFINAIRMVVIPLVVAVIFTAVARLGDPRKLGRMGGYTLGFFWASIFPAILLGMGAMWLGLRFAPEIEMPVVAATEAPELPGFVDFLVGLIPANPFAAAADGSLLSLIVFTVLLAAAAGALDEERRKPLVDFFDSAGQALIKLTWWILWTAPVGIFALAAPATARLGWDLVQNLAVFVVCVLVALGLYIVLMYLIPARLVAGLGPRRMLGGTFGAISVAFSTTSTVTSLPVALEEAQENLGVSETVADLVIPLGASMYRAGSALFQGASIVFLAHLYDVPFPLTALGGAVLATFLVSLTVAPVPSSGVMTLAPALEAVGIPLSGLAILLGIDRVPDMFRSATNNFGQITTAVLVDAWVGDADGGGDAAHPGGGRPPSAPSGS